MVVIISTVGRLRGLAQCLCRFLEHAHAAFDHCVDVLWRTHSSSLSCLVPVVPVSVRVWRAWVWDCSWPLLPPTPASRPSTVHVPDPAGAPGPSPPDAPRPPRCLPRLRRVLLPRQYCPRSTRPAAP